jgi:outer membrane autotransporter protein
LFVPFSGTGTLTIQNGGQVISGQGTIGNSAGSVGTVTVTGPGSTWTTGNLNLNVGNMGTGTLTIQDNGLVHAGGTVNIARLGSASTGTIDVLGGVLETTQILRGAGNATLLLDSGGTLRALANSPDFISNIPAVSLGPGGGGTIDSNGFDLTISSPFSGNGSLTKINAGTVTLTGTSSYGGNTIVNGGTLNIENGVTVSNNFGYLGFDLGTAGTVNVIGPSSNWTNRNQLVVGNFGTGSLNITKGGQVTSASGRIGVSKGSDGVVTVDGTNSTWTNISSLVIGGNPSGPGGTGLLEIINGGTVIANTSMTIWNTGTLAVDANFTLTTPLLTVNGGTILTLADTTFPNSAALGNTPSGSGIILDSNGFNSTFSGVYTGSGGLTKINAGTVILTGDSTYIGGTTISAGTLQLGNGGTTGSITGDVTDNGTLVFNHGSGTTTFAGAINGSGSVVKLGSDALVLTANNTYSGGTTIEDGTIEVGTLVPADQPVSTSLGTGNVFVDPGTLRTTSASTGVPLIIQVKGNYTQAAGGTLQLGIGGLQGEQYDHVQVGGNANVNGTLSVFSLNNFHPSAGNLFGVLRTAGSRSGNFSLVDDSQFNTKPNISPKLRLVDVELVASNGIILAYVAAAPTPAPSPTPPSPGPSPSPTPPSPGPSPTPPTPGPSPTPIPNPRPPIVEVIPDPIPPVNPDEPPDRSFVLRELDPTAEQLTSMFEIPFSGANTRRFNLTDRMTQIQRGSTGFVSPLPTPQPTGKETVLNAPSPVFQATPENHWGVWVNGWGNWVSVDNDNSIKGYDFTTGGVTVGVDYRVTEHIAVGGFGTYAHTWTNFNPGDVDVNTGGGGLYATYWNQGFYFNTGIYGGGNGYDTHRQTLLQGQFASGNTSGYEFSTFADTGYNFHFGHLSFGPVFAAQYTNVHIDGYTERGGFLPLNIHGDSEESWRTDLGLQAYKTWPVGKITVIPSLWMAWEHEYKYSRLPITFSAAGFPGASATVFGPDVGHDSFIINAGAGVQWTPRISTYIGYQGQLGRTNYTANGVTGTISFSF